MRLLIDIGNTAAKVALVSGEDYVIMKFSHCLGVDDVKGIELKYDIEYVALSCVGSLDKELIRYLKNKYGNNFLEFSSQIKIPVENLYQTPETLGCDRILTAIAANKKYPFNNVLIIDLGSAITIDFINDKGAFLGGNISPGVRLRFRSLNQFTSQLPLCEMTNATSLCGANTNEAIELGVINGVLYELKGYINDYLTKYDNLKIIFTGGDAEYFAGKIEFEIYVDFKLIFRGLNTVIDYNVEN